MKHRQNQLVAIQCSEQEIILAPIILAGGENAEYNRLAMIDNLERMFGGKWQARIVYHWRSNQHLKRWLDRGGKWRQSYGQG
jgi:hypothetical protein